MASTPVPDQQQDLAAQVAALRWYHTIDLGGGVVTPGHDPTPKKLARLGLPADLTGRTVLDIGAWDGAFSFEAKRRGAARVLATDSFIWQENDWGSKRGFELARRTLGLDVEDREIDPLDLSAAELGRFDVVFFLGVLYHMRHPLLALEKAFDVTGDMLILETSVDMLGARRPAAAFYPGTELAADATNWWGPNPAAVEAMLRTVGFTRVEQVWPTSRVLQVGRAGRRFASAVARKARGETHLPGLESTRQGRVVFHAFR